MAGVTVGETRHLGLGPHDLANVDRREFCIDGLAQILPI
jgi:hypothetical protein